MVGVAARRVLGGRQLRKKTRHVLFWVMGRLNRILHIVALQVPFIGHIASMRFLIVVLIESSVHGEEILALKPTSFMIDARRIGARNILFVKTNMFRTILFRHRNLR